jgi:hypothetical protein
MTFALPHWVFDNFLFNEWPGRWFAAENWRQFTLGFSIGLSLLASGLLMLEQRARRIGYIIPERVRKAVYVGFALLAFLTYFDFGNPNTRWPAYYHRHEFYHYYMGSKYFDEIGYKRLYTCTAIAEVEAGRGAQVKELGIRDLEGHNSILPTGETYVFSDPSQCKSHFSDARWRDFKTDVAWFESVARGNYWDKMRTDHGYNPPPVWTMAGKLLASLAPAGDHFFKLLACIDVLLQLGALLMLGWAFGLRSMAIAAVFWGCNAPANFYWTGGAFLRQDWFFFFVAALCLARKRKFALSGAALSWSSLLRIFPIVTFAGVALIILFDLIRKRRLRPDYRNFILGSSLAACLLIGVSSAVSGVDSYTAFAKHISSHKGTPLTNNMGLETILAHGWDGRMIFTLDERLDDSVQGWKQGYTARTAALQPLRLLIAAAVFAWLAWALRRTKLLWVGMALSVPLLMSVLSLTCYYYAFFVAPAVLVLLIPALGPAYLALAAASQILLTRFYWIDDQYAAESWLFYAFALSTLYALSRPFSLARLRAWWAGQPEPRADAASSRHPLWVSRSPREPEHTAQPLRERSL